MEIYLVRHTETQCEKGICYGQSDVALQTNYEQQFKHIKDQLPTDAVFYSSPLQRCMLLAEFVSEGKFTTDPRLMEMHFGDWELQSWDNIAPEEINPWMADFVNIAVPNGESFLQLHQRVTHFMQTELQQKNTKPIVIITHAGVIRSILCKLTNLPLQDAFTNKVDFGQVLKL